MRFYKFAAVLFLLAGSAFAADVDGKWTGTVATPNGDFPQTFTFKADGAALSGSLMIMEGMEVPIADGKIEGNNISFSITLDFGMPFKLTYTGVVAGKELKIKGDAGGMPFEFTLKKA
jgi:hydrogenase/urease accessory protein HupE